MAGGSGKELSGRDLFGASLFAGGAAGLFVDMILYPLDTLKTRLQAEQGFRKAGGFRGIYKGIGPQAIGSAPQAALFFLTYETLKKYMEPSIPSNAQPLLHTCSASIAEIVACIVRVPMEVVKQRRQTTGNTSLSILINAYRTEGLWNGLYRGFGSTIFREVPFSAIQFPILELLKINYKFLKKNPGTPLESWEVANCGAIAGGFSAAITTPLDVVKTRIMLARHNSSQLRIINVFANVYRQEGVTGLFAGFVPRVLWITLGGYIFFGTYDFARNFYRDYI